MKDLPAGAVIVSRELYEANELADHAALSSDSDEFEAEKHDTNFTRRTRYSSFKYRRFR